MSCEHTLLQKEVSCVAIRSNPDGTESRYEATLVHVFPKWDIFGLASTYDAELFYFVTLANDDIHTRVSDSVFHIGGVVHCH